MWHLSHRFDRVALPLANKHYNRQKPNSPQFVPPGRCVVLLTEKRDALWVTSWPFAEYVKHQWPGAWVNSLFRNESRILASQLILEAISATRAIWPNIPPLGLVTFVDPQKIKSTHPGYCYLCAGFKKVGKTKGGLVALQMTPENMPTAEVPHGYQMTLFGFGNSTTRVQPECKSKKRAARVMEGVLEDEKSKREISK